VEIPPGSESGACTEGLTRNLGDPVDSASDTPVGAAGQQWSRLAGARCSATCKSEEKGTAAVPPSEGNEARRDGRRGVAALS
jgi:hypothetical protein